MKFFLIWSFIISTSLTANGNDDICKALQFARQNYKVLLNPDYVNLITKKPTVRAFRIGTDISILGIVNGQIVISKMRLDKALSSAFENSGRLSYEAMRLGKAIQYQQMVFPGNKSEFYKLLIPDFLDNFKNGEDFLSHIRKINPKGNISDALAKQIVSSFDEYVSVSKVVDRHLVRTERYLDDVRNRINLARAKVGIIDTGLNQTVTATSRLRLAARFGTRALPYIVNVLALADLAILGTEIYADYNILESAVKKDPQLLLLPKLSDEIACDRAKKIKDLNPTILSWALLAKVYQEDKENFDKGFLKLDTQVVARINTILPLRPSSEAVR